MRITIADPPEEGVELKLKVFRAMEDIPYPAGGRLVYCPKETNRAYIMSKYASMEGWQPAGLVVKDYDFIQKGQLFWVIYHGPAVALTKTEKREA